MKKPLLLFAVVASVACGQSDGDVDMQQPEPAPAMVAPSVTIVAPREGEVFEEPDVTVLLETTVTIAPAGEMTPGTGHHHLYLDADLGSTSEPVPTVPGSIVHMGNGAATYTFEGVSSGPHRLIAVVADGAHVPLQPLVVDTVYFVVE